MSWAQELEELKKREAPAEQIGGEERVSRQHGRGKMDARARLAALVDDGSFLSAERFNVEGIIDPRDTRPLLCEFAELAWRRLESKA